MKERARLWVPATYSEWWQSYLIYFQTLVHETLEWQGSERTEACEFMLEAVENQIKVPPCTELAFQVLDTLVKDDAMSPYKLNRFFFHWQEYQKDEQDKEIAARLRSVARRYTQRDLTRRLQRYVIDVDWSEWDDEFRERHGKSRNRAKCLVNALARRIAKNPELFSTVQHLLAPSSSGPALWHFGEQLARFDAKQNILSKLEKLAKESKHEVCLRGYLSFIKISDPDFYDSWVKRALNSPQLAWLGVSVALRTDYVDDIFLLCLDALHKRWVGPLDFGSLRYGRSIESLPPERVARLFLLLDEANTEEGLSLLLEFMDSISFDDSFPCSSDFVFDVVVRTIPRGEQGDRTHGHYWKDVCLKLVKWDSKRVIPLLEVMLDAMREAYHLTYDSSVSPLADELARLDSQAAWTVIAEQFVRSLPKWRSDLFSWLKGGLASFDEEGSKGVIAELPVQSVLEWIEQDMESRAALIAHTAPGTLDDEYGGRLTRGLLARFGQIEGVSSGISATFHSGGWTGLTSDFLKRKREKLRRWLASDFEFEVTQWIEAEISYLDKRIEAEETQEERSRFD